jgi:superfamily I DNA and/or RNA helicase
VDVDVETSTVEAFQGREKEIVLIHFVVASDDEENPFRFVSDLNRLCVATTRAKRFQFMFGGWAITAVLSLVFSSTMSFLSFHTLTS